MYKTSVGNTLFSDTLILDGFSIQMEMDTVNLNDSNQVDYWKQDLKPLPKSIIWFHSLGLMGGVSGKEFTLDSQLPLLSSIDPQRRNLFIQNGYSWNSMALLTNNIGISLGLSFSQFHFTVINASLSPLNNEQLPFNLSIQNSQLQAVIKTEMDQGLFELDTISSPIERLNLKITNIQMPVLLNYIYESKSEVWRCHAGMGVLGQYQKVPAFNYGYIDNHYLFNGKASSVVNWSASPVAIFQLDRAFSNRNNLFVRCTGS